MKLVLNGQSDIMSFCPKIKDSIRWSDFVHVRAGSRKST